MQARLGDPRYGNGQPPSGVSIPLPASNEMDESMAIAPHSGGNYRVEIHELLALQRGIPPPVYRRMFRMAR